MANILRKQGRTIGSSGGSGGGGLTEEEHDALMSIASMPARGDINPECNLSGHGTMPLLFPYNNNQAYTTRIPILGYAKIGLGASRTITCKMIKADNTQMSSFTISGTASLSNYIDIPEDVVELAITPSTGADAVYSVYYSLLTSDSPYNPDNQ